jgi:hypothetical protein
MARSRSIPTQLFWDPAFSLLDSDTQIILLGLTLIADDEGRGLAQTRFLVRQFDKDATLIEQALTTLTEIGFLVCYEIGSQRYYQHLHWQEWETLSKPTSSRYPAPPHHEDSVPSEIPQENSKKPREILPEEEGRTWQTQKQLHLPRTLDEALRLAQQGQTYTWLLWPGEDAFACGYRQCSQRCRRLLPVCLCCDTLRRYSAAYQP